MKYLLLSLILLICLPMFPQKSFEILAYQSVAPELTRQKFKIQTEYKKLSGYSHLGLDIERFQLDDYQAVGASVEFGYTFDNFIVPIELTPLVSYGYFWYDGGRVGKRLQVGLDMSYIVTGNMKFHLLANVGHEEWKILTYSEIPGLKELNAYSTEDKLDFALNLYVGISYNP